MAAKCSSCGADILWATTVAGKKMPLSVKSHEKRFMLREPMGETPQAQLVETYLSHFVDCPYATQHRRYGKVNG